MEKNEVRTMKIGKRYDSMENTYCKRLILDLFAATFADHDYKKIERELYENHYNWKLCYQNIRQWSTPLQDKVEIVKNLPSDEIDLFDLLNSSIYTPEISHAFGHDSKFSIMTPSNVLQLKPDDIYDYITSKTNLCVLLQDCLPLINSGTKENIHIVSKVIITIISLCFAQRYDLSSIKHAVLNALEPIISIWFTYCDELRVRMFQLSFILIDPHSSKSVTDFRQASQYPLYHAVTEECVWIQQLEKYIFRGKSYEFDVLEAKALLAFILTPKDVQKSEMELVKRLESRLGDIIKNDYNSQAFIKFSSRSPKDAGFNHPDYEKIKEQLALEWKEKYKISEFTEFTNEALAQIACVKCLKVCSGHDAMRLFCLSERTIEDLRFTLDSFANCFDLSIILREYIEMPVHYEVRTFVRNRIMRAMTQYFSSSYFPFVSRQEWIDLAKKIKEFYEKELRDEIPMDDCTIDFVRINNQIKVIELNTFGEGAGPALFNWEKDQDVLYNGPCEFRFISNENGQVVKLRI